MSPQHLRNLLLYGVGDPVDITVANGRIHEVLPAREASEAAQIALPGLVDLHVHFRDPAPTGSPQSESESLSTGARAAAAGGFTEVFAMANTSPVTDTPERWFEMSRRARGLDVGIHPVSSLTIGLDGRELVNIEAMHAMGARIFSDDGRCLGDSGLAREAMMRLAALGAFYAEHAQEDSVVGEGVVDASVADALGVPGWPPAGEARIVERDIKLAAETGCRVHFCHVSTRESVALVRAAKADGLPVTAEVTPHHLALTATDAAQQGPALKVNPPLRSDEDVASLREALLDGTIDVVATDHAPHTASLKNRGWREAAFGLTGIETALGVVAGVVREETASEDWHRVAQLMSVAPRALAGLTLIELIEGAEASMCVVASRNIVVDPTLHRSLSRNSPFAGWNLSHGVTATFRHGRRTFTAYE